MTDRVRVVLPSPASVPATAGRVCIRGTAITPSPLTPVEPDWAAARTGLPVGFRFTANTESGVRAVFDRAVDRVGPTSRRDGSHNRRPNLLSHHWTKGWSRAVRTGRVAVSVSAAAVEWVIGCDWDLLRAPEDSVYGRTVCHAYRVMTARRTEYRAAVWSGTSLVHAHGRISDTFLPTLVQESAPIEAYVLATHARHHDAAPLPGGTAGHLRFHAKAVARGTEAAAGAMPFLPYARADALTGGHLPDWLAAVEDRSVPEWARDNLRRAVESIAVTVAHSISRTI